MSHRKVIIIGSGPAGYTAAIYVGRANLNPLLISGNQPGGQLTTTTEVENFPGFEHGIMGPDLMVTMEKQAKRFGTEILTAYVTEVDLKSTPYKVKCNKGEYTADSIIISTGATARLLDAKGEKELMGYGVSTCATCDGAFFREKKIAVVGGGDSACEEAVFLTRFGSEVYLIHRRDELRASKIMQDRVFNHPKIKVIWNSKVEEIIGDKDNGVQKIKLVDTNNQVSELDMDAVFVAIGHVPNTSLFNDITKDENGYLVPEPNSTKTNIPGVFACGDVQDHVYRQAITAAGSGCMAALDCERYLEGLHS